ncbi:hypothetical protein GMRT_15162 [Giardia muris]|uniref:Uncharacterized protein n=1 Tax=Giardia muris TaxID=5742 RepID=A0A4Z1SX43_GIAMU|nr:hypothetical protein GMRT_15162 [Giardia muris]|eukprot:TNJ28098.1 hypothetical protein GMRT_15162 [Giardia muris]
MHGYECEACCMCAADKIPVTTSALLLAEAIQGVLSGVSEQADVDAAHLQLVGHLCTHLSPIQYTYGVRLLAILTQGAKPETLSRASAILLRSGARSDITARRAILVAAIALALYHPVPTLLNLEELRVPCSDLVEPAAVLLFLLSCTIHNLPDDEYAQAFDGLRVAITKWISISTLAKSPLHGALLFFQQAYGGTPINRELCAADIDSLGLIYDQLVSPPLTTLLNFQTYFHSDGGFLDFISPLLDFLERNADGYGLARAALSAKSSVYLAQLFLSVPLSSLHAKFFLLRELLATLETTSCDSHIDAVAAEICTILEMNIPQRYKLSAVAALDALINKPMSYACCTRCTHTLAAFVVRYPGSEVAALALSLEVLISRPDYLELVKLVSEGLPRDTLVLQYFSYEVRRQVSRDISETVELFLKQRLVLDNLVGDALIHLEEFLGTIVDFSRRKPLPTRIYYYLVTSMQGLLRPIFSPQTQQGTESLAALGRRQVQLASLYWGCEPLPLQTYLEAVENLRQYGRGSLCAIDSLSLWLIINHLSTTRQMFDHVGTISFLLVQLDGKQEATVTARYLATLISIFCTQTETFRKSECGRSLCQQIWHFCKETTETFEAALFLRENIQALIDTQERQFVGNAVSCIIKAVNNLDLTPLQILSVGLKDLECTRRNNYFLLDYLLATIPANMVCRVMDQTYIPAFSKVAEMTCTCPGFGTVAAFLLLLATGCGYLQGRKFTRNGLSERAFSELHKTIERAANDQAPWEIAVALLITGLLQGEDYTNSKGCKDLIQLFYTEVPPKESPWYLVPRVFQSLQCSITTSSLTSQKTPLDRVIYLIGCSTPQTIDEVCFQGVCLSEFLIGMLDWAAPIPPMIRNFRDVIHRRMQTPLATRLEAAGVALIPARIPNEILQFSQTLDWQTVCQNGLNLEAIVERILILILCARFTDITTEGSINELPRHHPAPSLPTSSAR